MARRIQNNNGFTPHYTSDGLEPVDELESDKVYQKLCPLGHSVGFTLIELILVTLLIGALFSLSITAIDGLVPEYRLRSSLRSIADNVRLAKTHAVSISKDVFLQYDLSNNDYWLLIPMTSEKNQNKYIEYETLFYKQLPSGITFENLILPMEKDSKVTSGAHTIKFSPFGFSGYHIVNLKGDGDSKGAVKVNGLTGAITFFDETQNEEKLLQDE